MFEMEFDLKTLRYSSVSRLLRREVKGRRFSLCSLFDRTSISDSAALRRDINTFRSWTMRKKSSEKLQEVDNQCVFRIFSGDLDKFPEAASPHTIDFRLHDGETKVSAAPQSLSGNNNPEALEVLRNFQAFLLLVCKPKPHETT
ncbi:uncharacterized [Tachysurus ichikawai]